MSVTFWRAPGRAGGGAGDGSYWVQPVLPVVPDLDIISSGALFVRWVDRCQFVLEPFLVVDSGWISLLYEKL